MSKDAFRQQLQVRLKEVSKEIAAAEERHHGAELADRVHAAGELAVLKQREAEILAKIEKLEHEPDGVWETLKTEIEEDLDAIGAAIQRLFVGR